MGAWALQNTELFSYLGGVNIFEDPNFWGKHLGAKIFLESRKNPGHIFW